MKLKGIINIDGREDDKDVGLEENYTLFKGEEDRGSPSLRIYTGF